MRQRREVETEVDVLTRIMARLLAFAALADRAAGMPYLVRCFLLCVLRFAESVARDFVAGPDEETGDRGFTASRRGNDASDARRLATSFRALARALELLIAQIRQFGWRDAAREPGLTGRPEQKARKAAGAILRWLSAFGFLAATPYPDTS